MFHFLGVRARKTIPPLIFKKICLSFFKRTITFPSLRHLSFKAVTYDPLGYYLCYHIHLISLHYCSAIHPPVSYGFRGEGSPAAGQSCTLRGCCRCCPDYRGASCICSVELKSARWDAEDVCAASSCMGAVSRLCALNS